MVQLLTLTSPALLAADFFVLEGPNSERLACQWTSPRRSGGTNEFEIITPHNPETMGSLFGLYDAQRDCFRMRMAVDPNTFCARDDIQVDLEWRGDLNSVLDIGDDWDWDRAAGCMTIAHRLVA